MDTQKRKLYWFGFFNANHSCIHKYFAIFQIQISMAQMNNGAAVLHGCEGDVNVNI